MSSSVDFEGNNFEQAGHFRLWSVFSRLDSMINLSISAPRVCDVLLSDIVGLLARDVVVTMEG